MGRQQIKGLTVEVNGDATGLKKALNDAASKMRSFERSYKSINQSIQLDPSNIELYNQKQEILNATIEETKSTLKELTKYQQDLDTQGVEKTNEGYQKTVKLIAECKNKLTEYKKEINGLPASWQAFVNKLDSTATSLDTISQKTSALSKAFQLIGSAAVNATLDYESQIASIKKIITDISDDTIQKLKDIAVDTGKAFESVSEYATIGATLGIAEKDLASFTQTMVDLQTATNDSIVGEEGAKAVARFLNVLGLGTDQAHNFGSAITYVGDQFAATGDEILSLASQMAGVATIANVSQYDLIGLAAEMKNLGLRTNSSASAITRTFMKIENSIELTDKSLKTFANTAGMSAEEFSSAWSSDAIGTFLKFTDGLKSSTFDEITKAVNDGASALTEYADALGITTEAFAQLWQKDANATFEQYLTSLEELSDESDSASVVLNDVGLSGVRTAEALLKLAGNGEVVTNAIKDANKAWNEDIALTDKANTVYKTAKVTLEGTKEAIRQAGASIGEILLPGIKSLAEYIKDLSQGFTELNDGTKWVITSFVALGASVSGATKILATGMRDIKSISDFIGNLAGDTSKCATETSKFATSTNALVKALGSVGLYGAITLVAGGTAYLVAKSAVLNDEFYKLNQTTKELNNSLESANDKSNEQYASFETGLSYASVYADKLKEILGLYNDETTSQEKRTEYQEIIKSYIEQINSALGEERLRFDEVNGIIDSQGEKIDDVTNKFEELAKSARRSAWLTANQEEYQGALNALNEITSLQSTYLDTLYAKIKDYPKEDIDYMRGLLEEFNVNGDGTAQALASSSQYWLGIYSALRNYDLGLQELNVTQQEATTVVDNYNKVVESTADNFDITLQAINGSSFLLEDTLSGLQKQLDEVITKKEALAAAKAIDQTELDSLNQQIALIQQAIDKTTERETNNDILALKEQQMMDSNAEHFNLKEDEKEAYATEKATTVANDVETKMATSANNSYDKWIQTIDNWVAHYNAIQLSDKYITIHEVVERTTSGGGSSGGYGGSLGYGDRLNNITKSIGKTLGNKKYNSSGFSSGGVVLNNTINVNNNGTSISTATINSWADIMTNRINDNLGRLL